MNDNQKQYVGETEPTTSQHIKVFLVTEISDLPVKLIKNLQDDAKSKFVKTFYEYEYNCVFECYDVSELYTNQIYRLTDALIALAGCDIVYCAGKYDKDRVNKFIIDIAHYYNKPIRFEDEYE